MTNLAQLYQEKIAPELAKEFGLKNVCQIPHLEKVVLNVGLGDAVDDHSVIEKAAVTLTALSGQKPKVTFARQAISGFKLRQGMPIGLMVTLRKEKMFFFLEKLFKIVFPRLRDFQGVPTTNFDGQGNYNLGLAEQMVFPEVDYEKVDKNRGLQITIITSTKDDAQARSLLRRLGMPFAKSEEEVK